MKKYTTSLSKPLNGELSGIQDSIPKILFNLVQSCNFKKLSEFLALNPNLHITTFLDDHSHFLLHVACFHNQFEICRLLLNYAKENQISQPEINDWVNGKTPDGYCPLHFASYHGNINLIKLLEDYGANFYIRTSSGLTIMHTAAEGDQPISIVYFRNKGLSLKEKDYKGFTPLHKAAERGMENAIYYLTSWDSLPNETENDGCTPLHLAVIPGNVKVVRRLLIKGADSSIKNKEGKTPKDLAIENNDENIQQLFKEGNNMIECLGIKSKLRKERTKTSYITNLILGFVLFAASINFLFPFVKNVYYIFISLIFFSLTLSTFLLASSTDPGRIQSNEKKDIFTLLLNNGPHLICPDCAIIKPQRSRHCECCNNCINNYYHHCPWIDNCVGVNNYHYFLMFIFSTLLLLIWMNIIAGLHLTEDDFEYNLWSIQLQENALIYLKFATCVMIFVLGAVFLFPLAALNYLHLGNIYKNQTTYERFNYNNTAHKVFNFWRSQKDFKNGVYTKVNY